MKDKICFVYNKIYTYRLVVILLVAFLVIIPFFWPSKDIEANGIFDTASDMNAWSVGDPEVNQLLYGTACPISPAQGSLWGGLMKPWAKILSTDYQTYSEFLAEVTESDGNGGCKITAENFVQRQARLNNPDATRGLSGVVLAASNKLLDERPASGQVYFQQQVYAIKNLGQVNAQDNADALYYPGNGFTLLKPIQDFWGWSVNIVYGLMIFLIIGVAFSIMFRAQLPGGVSVTIQNAIPNIALAMILIPLSYAISGLFIDSVTIGTNVVRQFLIGPGAPARSVYENRNCDSPDDNNKPPGCIGYAENDRGLYPDDPRLTWYSSGGNVNVSDEIQHGLQSIGSTIIGDNLGLTVAAILEVLGQSDGGPIAWIGDIINFFIRILLFFTGLRILKLLLMKYLVFLLAPIASPFIFATIAIPGNGTKQIMQFAKIMGAASLFYIVTYAMFLLAIIFSTEAFQNSIPDLGKSGYVPPLLGLEELISGGGDLLFNSVNALVFGVLAIMIYLNVPNILNSIDDSMGTKAVIPTFVSGAFSSAKDSLNLANDIRKNATFREGAVTTKMRNAALVPTRAVGKFSAATYNRMVGVKAGQQGSAEDKMNELGTLARTRIGNLINRGGAARAVGEILQKGTNLFEGSMTGLTGVNMRSGGSIHEEGKEIGIDFKFTFPQNPDNTIEFTVNEIIQIFRSCNVDPASGAIANPAEGAPPVRYIARNNGKLTLMPKDFEFGRTIDPMDIAVVSSPAGFQRGITQPFKRLSNGNDPFMWAYDRRTSRWYHITNGMLKLLVSGSNPQPYPTYGAGKLLEIKFELVIERKPGDATVMGSLVQLFGKLDPLQKTFVGGMISGSGVSGGALVTDAVAFGISGYGSAASLKIPITMQKQ